MLDSILICQGSLVKEGHQGYLQTEDNLDEGLA